MPFREVTADQKRNLEIAKDIMRDMGFPDSVIKDRAARLFLAFNGIDMDGCWDKAENLVMTIHESIARISAGSRAARWDISATMSILFTGIREKTLTAWISSM